MNQKIISIIIATVLLGGVGYFIYNDLATSDNDLISGEKSSTTTPDVIVEDDSQADDIFENGIPKEIIPNLNREFVVPEIYSEEIIQNTTAQHEAIVSLLEKDNKLRNEWLQLALLRSAVEDYEGAEEIWLYMTQVWTLDHVAFGNLGNLYNTNLPDVEKSKDFYILALEKRPDNLNYYDNLYNIFRFRLGDNATALSLLEQGGNLLPEEVYFPRKKAEHYQSTGDVENAKKYFEETVILARNLGLTEIASYAEEELEKLK